jgi:hypothetical protein
MLGFHHTLFPHIQSLYHFPQSKVKEITLHTVSAGLDQHISACTSDEQNTYLTQITLTLHFQSEPGTITIATLTSLPPTLV